MPAPRLHSVVALALVALESTLAGCYLAHERPACASEPTHDDAGPSDPATPPRDDEAALEADGDPVFVDGPRVFGGDRPSLVFDGEGFGATWTGGFRVLDGDGAPLAGGPIGGYTGLAFVSRRYALAAPDSISSRLLFFDHGAARVAQVDYDSARWSDVAWLESASAWVVVSEAQAPHRGSLEGLRVDSFDLAGERVATLSHVAGIQPNESTIRIAATSTRALAAWVDIGTVRAVVLGGSPLGVIGEPFAVLDQESAAGEGFGASFPTVVAYGEQFLVTGSDLHRLFVALVDPSVCPPVVEPVLVARTETPDRRVGIAAIPERGFFVVCYPDQALGAPPGEIGVTLRVMGEDGRPWGTPLPLVTGLGATLGVDCGWNGREVVVIWTGAPVDSPDPPRVQTQRARPTFL